MPALSFAAAHASLPVFLHDALRLAELEAPEQFHGGFEGTEADFVSFLDGLKPFAELAYEDRCCLLMLLQHMWQEASATFTRRAQRLACSRSHGKW